MPSKLETGIRFAPSPTGRFHVGNLRTAWISHRLASGLEQPWVVRVEDIDTPRVLEGAWSLQLEDLNQLGLRPDTVVVQSQRYDRHLELFEKARKDGFVYPCDCSRKDVQTALRTMGSAPHESPAEYSGRCRHRFQELSPPASLDLTAYRPTETLAWRWRSDDPTGHHDAIVARTDSTGRAFVPGYHFACAADDAEGNYAFLVRAWDLATADTIQRQIRRWLSVGYDPVVFHTTLITRDDGHRLEKRTEGVTLPELLAQGISTSFLLDAFETSFDLKAALTAIATSARPSGETLRSRTLKDLGIA